MIVNKTECSLWQMNKVLMSSNIYEENGYKHDLGGINCTRHVIREIGA